MVKILLRTGKVDVDARDTGYGQTPLSGAARNGHYTVVKMLLDMSEVDIDAKDLYG